jgi:hypothetical protein
MKPGTGNLNASRRKENSPLQCDILMINPPLKGLIELLRVHVNRHVIITLCAVIAQNKSRITASEVKILMMMEIKLE